MNETNQFYGIIAKTNHQEKFINNKRVIELSEEVQNKDKLIISLQKQIMSLENSKIQSETLKKSNYLLTEKLNNFQEEIQSNSVFYSDQLKQISESENKLRMNLISKDKIIHDYSEIIKENENTIICIRRHLMEHESNLSLQRQEISELNARNKNLASKIQQKDDEITRMKEKEQSNFSKFSAERGSLMDQNNELRITLNKYSKDNNDLNQINNNLEIENKTLKNLNNKLKDTVEELSRINSEYREQFQLLNQIKEKFNENQRILEKTANELENERNNNLTLRNFYNEANEKLIEFREKYSGENTLENLKTVIYSLNLENENLKQNLENLNKINTFNETKVKVIDDESNEIYSSLNSEIRGMIQWVDTYLSSYFNDDYEIADMPITIHKSLISKVNFSGLKESLVNCRININNEFRKIESNNKNLKNEINQHLNNQQRLLDELNSLKKEFNEKNEEILKLQNVAAKRDLNEINNNSNNIDELEKSKKFLETRIKNAENQIRDFTIKYQSLLSYDSIKGHLELDLNSLIDSFIKYVQNENLNKSNDSIKNNKIQIDQKLVESLKTLQLENDLLQKKIENYEIIQNSRTTQKIDHNVNEHEQLTQLNKRLTNLNRELELKDIQIKSQEQMILRRNKEIEELRNKVSQRTNPNNQNLFQTNSSDIEVSRDYDRKSDINRSINMSLKNNFKSPNFTKLDDEPMKISQGSNKFNENKRDSQEPPSNEIKGIRSRFKKSN